MSSSKESVAMTPEQQWRHLRTEGLKLVVNLQSNDKIQEKPAWLDEARFAKAKEAIQKFFLGLSYSSFTGLLMILQLPDGLEPLLSTGNSKDIPALYWRYLSTILHVNSWYDDDVFDPKTKGYQSVRQVRAMHKRLQSIMNDKFKVRGPDGEPRIWMSQYDMALTQFAFIGLGMLYPHRSAMIAATHEDLELINYYWRVLGWLMGIEDEFNACCFDKYQDIYEFNKLILDHEYKDKFKESPCETGLGMTQSICIALHYYMPLLTFNSLAHWWKDELQFNGYQLQPLSGRERILDFWTRVSFNHLLKSSAFLKLSTKLHRKKFLSRLKNKDKVYEKLKTRYSDNPNFTYYSDRVDYFGQQSTKVESTVGTTNNNNNNNNNDSEIVHTKTPLSPTNGMCPFGYKAINTEASEQPMVSA